MNPIKTKRLPETQPEDTSVHRSRSLLKRIGCSPLIHSRLLAKWISPSTSAQFEIGSAICIERLVELVRHVFWNGDLPCVVDLLG